VTILLLTTPTVWLLRAKSLSYTVFPADRGAWLPRNRGLKDMVFRCSTAVCVPPGARLLLRDIPKPLQEQLAVGEIEAATFVEQSAEAFRYRDAVRFSNGREILLQDLHCGQRVEVLSLDCADRVESKPELRIGVGAPVRRMDRWLAPFRLS
jgi:hypothetical protein